VIRNASAGGDDGFASPRAFAAALFTAAESEPEPVREALVPAAVRALVRWPQTPRLAIGLAAGVSLSLLVAVTAAVVSEVATPVHARSLARLQVVTPAPMPALRTSVPAAPARPAVAFPAPATVTAPATAPVPTIREPRRSWSARRGVVWSDQHQGLVSVHELGKPADTAATPTAPPPFAAPSP
jgi:hypothetical protein